MKITHERGYLIPAIDSVGTQYLDCARVLADSIRHWHPDANITILTKDQLPYGDQGGWANDWQVFFASPYRETIKLEADMYAASPIDHWWTLFENRDVVVSRGCRDFYDNRSSSRAYRRVFDENHLPDFYNAITYWRLSKTAKDFFELVKSIFENWEHYKKILKFPDDSPSTDLVYAIAARIIGEEQVSLPDGIGPSIVHMKRKIIGCKTENWTKELIWEKINPGLRINTVAQWGLVHYHIKEWANESRNHG